MSQRQEDTVNNKKRRSGKGKGKVTVLKEDHSRSFHFHSTSCLLAVMMTFYPRAGAGPVPVEAAGKSGIEGHWGSGSSILKYTASGEFNYEPEEGQSLM